MRKGATSHFVTAGKAENALCIHIKDLKKNFTDVVILVLELNHLFIPLFEFVIIMHVS
jgi:hypothetical protein